MKSFIILFLALLLNLSCNAQVSIYKTWIGEKQEYLEMTRGISRLDIRNEDYENNDFKVTVKEGTFDAIKIPRNYQKRDEPIAYHFRVIKLTEDTLILSGNDSPTKFELYDKPEYLFISKQALVDKHLTFQKLEFTSSTCFGHCPEIHIAIDSLGKVHFLGGQDTKTKYKKMQIAQLSTKQLNQLIEILKNSCLDKFPEEMAVWLDAPTFHFVIYYNNTKMKSWGCVVPYTSRQLQDYLMNIYLKLLLKKLTKPDNFNWEVSTD